MVTDRLVAEMEKGIIPWNKPWHGSAGAISHSTGKPYSLLNQFILSGRKGEYITFNQCKAEGGKVKKGAHGYPIVFWRQFKITETDENGETAYDVRMEDGEENITVFTGSYSDCCKYLNATIEANVDYDLNL